MLIMGCADLESSQDVDLDKLGGNEPLISTPTVYKNIYRTYRLHYINIQGTYWKKYIQPSNPEPLLNICMALKTGSTTPKFFIARLTTIHMCRALPNGEIIAFRVELSVSKMPIHYNCHRFCFSLTIWGIGRREVRLVLLPPFILGHVHSYGGAIYGSLGIATPNS